MTKLNKPISRIANTALGAAFGADRRRRIVITIQPGNGTDRKDTFALKPERCRKARTEYLSVEEAYRYAIQLRVNREQLQRAREKKAKLQIKRERARERRFFAKA